MPFMRYLCRTAGEQSLYPADPKIASDIDRWLDWELAHYNRQFGFLVWETVAKPMFMGGEPNQVIVDWSSGVPQTIRRRVKRPYEGSRICRG